MKNKKRSPLWVIFTVMVFFVLFVGVVIAAGVAYLFFKPNHVSNPDQPKPFLVVLILLIFSGVVSLVLFIFIGRIVLNPIVKFSMALKEVAKGNFTEIELDKRMKIPEIIEMQKNFNDMVKELASIETLHTDFIANISHEFKTPLTSIEGYAMLLQDSELPDIDREEYAKIIKESAAQLNTLTGNILKLTRLENQELVVHKENFRLDEQIREVVLLLEKEWSQKKIQMDIQLERVTCFSNKNLLHQVWQNLLDNAIKFSAENGVIRIRLTHEENQMIVSIKDNGIGIAKEELSLIWGKFYQVDKTRNQIGNGLGLSLVRRILALCDGSVEVSSEIGVGSEFVVRFVGVE